jgi:dCMP deaminase
MRIGVAGLNGSGKTEAVQFLAERSFHAASLSDVIRAELARQARAPTREHMIECGRALRAELGMGVLAERTFRRLPSGQHHVIDSIRHPAEVAVLRRGGAFRLIWIDAPEAVRIARLIARARPGDAADPATLREIQAKELAAEEAGGQQLEAVRELADDVITNAGTLSELYAALHAIVLEALKSHRRPSWDAYFMDIAGVVASRSNCIKRMVGAVVVIDRRIISTGYNGTPRGVRNCNEGGCPRCASFGRAGASLDECLCSHAEENAITQAAYHGVSVRSGTIYTTHCPCRICTKLIINAGIREVVYRTEFPKGDISLALLAEAGVAVRAAQDTAGGEDP